jgi:hypothetical protein
MKWSSSRIEVMLLGLLAALATAGCATSASGACHSGEKRLVSETLYFGTATPPQFQSGLAESIGSIDAIENPHFTQLVSIARVVRTVRQTGSPRPFRRRAWPSTTPRA